MQIPRPPATGHQQVVGDLRSVLFSEPILGAARVRPKGSMKIFLAPLLGWWGHYLTRRATDPLPPTIIYVAITAADLRLYSKPAFASPFEIGRWPRGTYGASHDGSRLDLVLDRLGHVTAYGDRQARAVFDLVVEGARR